MWDALNEVEFVNGYGPINSIIYFQSTLWKRDVEADSVCGIRGVRSGPSKGKDHSYILISASMGQEICSWGINQCCAFLKRSGRLLNMCEGLFVLAMHCNLSFQFFRKDIKFSICRGLMRLKLEKHRISTLLQSSLRFGQSVAFLAQTKALLK